MNNTKNIGNYYEKVGKKFLENQGFNIIATNYFYKNIDIHKHLELDIVAYKDNILYFFEVKYRKNMGNFYPIGLKKIKNIHECIENFLYNNPQWLNYSINIMLLLTDGISLELIPIE